MIGNNIISNKYIGIYLSYSSDNTLKNKSVDACGFPTYGIDLDSSFNNTLTNNTLLNNYMGICLYYSSNNTLIANIASNNTLSIYVRGWKKSHYDNSIDTSNIVNGKPAYYYYDIHDQVIHNLDTTHLTVAWSRNITISNNNVSGGDGICLSFTEDSRLTSNTVLKNHFGIYLDHSSGNIIADNIASSNSASCIFLWVSSENALMDNNFLNTSLGIGLSYSSNNNITKNFCSNNNYGIYLVYHALNNIIYLNNFINNTQNAYDECTNQWDDGSEGNYRSTSIRRDNQ